MDEQNVLGNIRPDLSSIHSPEDLKKIPVDDVRLSHLLHKHFFILVNIPCPFMVHTVPYRQSAVGRKISHIQLSLNSVDEFWEGKWVARADN